jgi:hypothetical protein
MEEILKMLEKEKVKYKGIRLSKLEAIIEKIKQFKEDELFDPTDFTVNEKEEDDLEKIKAHILSVYSEYKEPCKPFILEIQKGISYYFVQFFDFKGPIDFENFHKFVNTDKCLCGKDCII